MLYDIYFYQRIQLNHETKTVEDRIYVICGIVMIASLIGILIFFKFLQTPGSEFRFVFWGETVALIAFGISWLTKGGTLYPDRSVSVAESDK